MKKRATGEPIRRLHVPYSHWRGTLRRLPIRYRKPYTARHSSVSWDLMIGRNPLWVAKQHGHSLLTMLRVYAAWTADALESDAEAIREAMGYVTQSRPTHSQPAASEPIWQWICQWRDRRIEVSTGKDDKIDGGEGGIRTHVPVLPDHPISSRRRYDRFGTSPSLPKIARNAALW